MKANEQKADVLLRKNMRSMLFSKLQEAFSLCKIERNIREAKNIEKAKDFYLKMLRKKLIAYLKKHLLFRINYEKNFENIREEFLKRTVFSKWFEKIPVLKEKNKKKKEEYDKIIKKFRLV